MFITKKALEEKIARAVMEALGLQLNVKIYNW